MQDSTIKCVNIGDTGVGKTCVLVSYTENEFPEEHVPTAFDNFTSIVEYKNNRYNVQLWDTSGQDNDSMRPISYNGAHIFLIFFSLVDRKSFERVREKWVKELEETNHIDLPYIIVGNKVDLRDDSQLLKQLGVTNPVTKKEGEELAKKVGALQYMECSAKTQTGLGEVFEAAVKAVVDEEWKKQNEAIKKKKDKGGKCNKQ
ncbi:hypothetical protein C9374_012568 [Naegleria lovaniensis]|uniref:Rho family small GTPase n=1 Tax=Naegleria lovaniensis TaxID=51637 RepID=A0AA88KQB5_NAELO|nr:uncharacterized protein C9374_012568 [Naegleria lovaniensis]KAG2392316.1 hypothetical protein C9374_012568 [Naegleria lovaniensis]